MAFKYINPGLANLFDSTITDIKQETDTSLIYSRTSGDYFYCTSNTRPSLYMEKRKEYWASFYWYPNKSATGSAAYLWLLGLYAMDTTAGIYVKRASTSTISAISLSFHNGANTVQYGNTVDFKFSLGKGYHVEVYVKDDEVNGKIVLWVNGQQVYEYNGKTGDGSGIDRMYFGGSSTSLDYFSDIVAQNTGRIGDMRVNRLPVNAESIICNWDSAAVPIGNLPKPTDDYIATMSTYILKQCQFASPGKLHAVVVSTTWSPTTLTFFLFRKNNDTGKYRSVEIRGVYNVPNSSVAKIIFVEPMQVQAGDYLGWYHNGGRVYCNTITNSANYNVVTADNLAQATDEVDMPTQTYKYNPCLCVLFESENGASGIESLIRMQKDNPEIASYGYLVVNDMDKHILCKIDEDKLNSLVIGRIDALAVTALAHYEGESAVKKLSYLLKSGINEFEGASQDLTTADMLYCLGVIDKDPSTEMPWTTTGIAGVQIGVKSKA